MPIFYAEEVRIDPIDFLDACTYKEISQLVAVLQTQGFLDGNSLDSSKMSPLDLIWMDSINKLAHNRHRLTNAEEEIINAMASKL